MGEPNRVQWLVGDLQTLKEALLIAVDAPSATGRGKALNGRQSLAIANLVVNIDRSMATALSPHCTTGRNHPHFAHQWVLNDGETLEDCPGWGLSG